MRILVTGVAGFIGMHVAIRLLADGHEVIGLDNINDYYDVRLKQARLAHIGSPNQFHFHKLDLVDRSGMNSLFAVTKPDIVINLAAQAGVRYSIENPHSYIDSNLVGFINILEACRHFEVGHLVYASSSSVYGANTAMPFSVDDNVNHPLSLYAATKKSNELMAHTYSHLYGLPTTGLRFFTVYGPWGRPDMALFKFTEAILGGKEIEVFNFGKHRRDFTYIDDIVEGVVRVAEKPARGNPNWNSELPYSGSSFAPWCIYNIGSNNPCELMDFIKEIEAELSLKAKLKFLPLQNGDVPTTFADIENLLSEFDYKPETSIRDGIKSFINWYKYYYEV